MSALTDELQRLLDFFDTAGQQPPTRRLRIVEIAPGTPVDSLGRLRVKRHALREVADYEERFDELMRAGLPWLNMSCYGVEDGTLLVGIEVPAPRKRSGKGTSVNFSGAQARVIAGGWKADAMLVIE